MHVRKQGCKLEAKHVHALQSILRRDVYELQKEMLNYKMLVQLSNILYCVRIMAYQVHMGISFK